MRGCLERMGPDDRSSGEPFASEECDGVNVESRLQDLCQVKNAAKKAALLFIVFVRAGRLEP